MKVVQEGVGEDGLPDRRGDEWSIEKKRKNNL